jgi:pimeloyl-ACP methyl ester carboxylesterase
MPELTVRGHQCYYQIEVEGDGFPLLLASGRQGAVARWRPIMPLLGELCRAIAYEYAQQACAAHTPGIIDLLDAIQIERTYLVADAVAAGMALHMAQQVPERLEGLIFIGKNDVQPSRPEVAWQWTAPTLILVGEQAVDHCQWAEAWVTQFPHCQRGIIPEAGRHPLTEQPRRLGQAMMQCLLHSERQRHLVRGASFLL